MIINKIIRKLAKFCGNKENAYDFSRMLCNSDSGEIIATNGKQVAIIQEFQNNAGEIQGGKTLINPKILDKQFIAMNKAKAITKNIRISRKNGINTYTPTEGEEIQEKANLDYFPNINDYIDRDKSKYKYITVMLCPELLKNVAELMKESGEKAVRISIPIETEINEDESITIEPKSTPIIFEQYKGKEITVHALPMKDR